MKFKPCIGKCSGKGTHCKGCGRSHKEIVKTRKMVKGLVALAKKMKYKNKEDFANSIAKSILRKLKKA
jgi:predicted Fe-S protein YdhL (DUF1289 family)